MYFATRLHEERRPRAASASASRRRSSRAPSKPPARTAASAHRDLSARRGRRPEHDRAVRRAAITTGAAEHRDPAARTPPTDAALDLDGFFGLHPRLAPLKPLWDARQLAIVHACGSPDGTRSHFDAQDYMESATPGVKSTQDGWLNRYLQAREHAEATPFRAVALAQQLPRALQGPRRRWRSARSASSASAPDRRPRWCRRRSKPSTPPPPTGAEQDRRRGVRRDPDAEDGRPAAYRPENGAEYPRSPFGQALRQIAQLVKADVGLEVAFAEVGGWDTHVNQGAANGQLATRLDDFGARHRRARARPRRSHGGHRHPDDVGVRPGGGRERQSRHRSRSRQRDDGHRRRRPRRQGLRPAGRASRPSSATKDAIWRSRPISATCSARSCAATSASPTPAADLSRLHTHVHAGLPRLSRSTVDSVIGIGHLLTIARVPAQRDSSRSSDTRSSRRPQQADAQHRAHAGGGRRARHAAAAARQDPQVAARRATGRSSAARSGICCAKLGEAEVFADAGIDDIRLPYPLNPANADRVFALVDRVTLSFIVDHAARRAGVVATSMRARRPAARCARQGGRRLPSLRHRSGRAGGARHSSRAVAALPGLQLRGLLSHAGHAYGARVRSDARAIAAEEARDAARPARPRAGVACDEISVGATPTARFSVAAGRPHRDAARQLRRISIARRSALGAASFDDCALTVLARVVSRAGAPTASILDCGSKTLTNDRRARLRRPAGTRRRADGSARRRAATDRLVVERLSEEHATVRVAERRTPLEPGDLVRDRAQSLVRRVEPGRRGAGSSTATRSSSGCRSRRAERIT